MCSKEIEGMVANATVVFGNLHFTEDFISVRLSIKLSGDNPEGRTATLPSLKYSFKRKLLNPAQNLNEKCCVEGQCFSFSKAN